MNRRVQKTVTTYMTVLALIFNAFWSAYAVANSNEQGVLLCTSQGYKWVKVAADESQSQPSGEHCKLCLFPPNDESSDALATTCGELQAALSPRLVKFASQAILPNGLAPYQLAQGRAPPFNTHIS